MLMNILDQTIVNVALPTIQRDLHFSQASLAWVIDAYLITFAGTLLLAGRLGDLIGRKKVFLVGVALFTVASIACGAADSQILLISARFVQGLGAALSSSVILAIIVADFPIPRERAKAMSSYIIVAVGGGSLGLLIGGYVTQALSWHWIFFINIPIGIATFVAGVALIEENTGLGFRAGLDIAGAILSTAGLMLAVYAIVSSSQYGWDSAHTLGFGAAALVVLGRLHPSRESTGHADDADAGDALAGPAHLEPGARTDGRRHVQHLLHRRPVLPARTRIRPDSDRIGFPAPDALRGADVGRTDHSDHERVATEVDRPDGPGRPGPWVSPYSSPQVSIPPTFRISSWRCCWSAWARPRHSPPC